MRHGTNCRIAALVSAAPLIVMSAGCLEWLMASHLASFGAGRLLRDMTTVTTTERVCYQNGLEVDCATLPDGVTQ